MFGQHPEDPHPFVYLSLDGGSIDGVIDSSADGITSNLVNFPHTPSPFVPGVVSNALMFTVNSYINLQNTSAINFIDGFSISLLFSGKSSVQRIPIAQATDTDESNWQLVVTPEGFVRMIFGQSGQTTHTFTASVDQMKVRDGEWHHIGVVYRAQESQVSIYVDGEAEAIGPVLRWEFSGLGEMVLGNPSAEEVVSSFLLDEVRIYKSSLSSLEIKGLAGKADGGGMEGDSSEMSGVKSWEKALKEGVSTNDPSFWPPPSQTQPSRFFLPTQCCGVTNEVFVPSTYFILFGGNTTIDFGGFTSFTGTGEEFKVIGGVGCLHHGGAPFPINSEKFDHTVCDDPGAVLFDGNGLNVFFGSTSQQEIIVGQGQTSFSTAAGQEYRFGFTDSFAGNDNALGWTITYTLGAQAPPKIFFSIPPNGTNLTVCVGTTNEVECVVQLEDETPVTMGKVNWSVSPGTLGTFTVNDVSLDGSGKAGTMFIASTDGGNGTMTATGTQLKDASNNSLPDANTNMMVNVPKVDLTEMWEKDDQCDNLTTINPKPTEDNRLYVSVEANDKAELHIKGTIIPSVAGVGKHFVWGVLDGANLLPESGTLQDNGEADVIFATTGDHKVYTIRVGCDKNGDEKLQQDEIVETPKPPVKPFTALVVTQNDYTAEKNFLSGAQAIALHLKIARSLLNTFLTGIPPDETIIGAIALSAGNPNLTHVAGATFTFPACTAAIPHYKFPDGSEVSDKVEKSNTIDAEECEFLLTKKAEVEAFFASSPDPEHEFTWEWTQTLDGASSFSAHKDRDLHNAFGVITLTATVKAVVQRDLKIKSVRTTGGFMDLYDFNYERGGLNISGATVQLGFNARAGNDAGRIFEDEVVIDSNLNKWKDIFTKKPKKK